MKKRKKKAKLLQIRIYGDAVLRKVAEPVTEITEELKEFIDDLIFTMYEKDGVGLAAPQVGKSVRIFVVDPFWVREDRKKNPIVLINPEFVKFEDKITSEEGCLSLPEVFEKVMRAKRVVIKGLNLEGNEIQIEADGLFSRSLQHEYDHLDGILFIDKVPKLKRILHSKKLKELKKTTTKNSVNVGEY